MCIYIYIFVFIVYIYNIFSCIGVVSVVDLGSIYTITVPDMECRTWSRMPQVLSEPDFCDVGWIDED